MRRYLSIILALLLAAAGLSGCTSMQKAEKQPDMYIEAAQLSQEEKKLADLLGANTGQKIFDFSLDDSVRSMRINTYELSGGTWTLTDSSGMEFSDTEGRIALAFDKIAEGLRVAVQEEHGDGSTAYSTDPETEYSGLSSATSMLSGRTEVVYEKEIPLVVQILTAKDEVTSYNVEYFEHPEKYEKYGYEHVYAITVRFSRSPLS